MHARRPGGSIRAMTKILAAHDSRSQSAVLLGAALARALDLPLLVATSYRPESLFTSRRRRPGTATERRRHEARAALQGVADIAGSDVAVETRAIPGTDVAKALVALAVECEAFAIAIGEDLDGGVTRDVMRRSPCPVAVAPRNPDLIPSRFERIGLAYDGSVGASHALAVARRIAMLTDAQLDVVGVSRSRGPAREAVGRALGDAADVLAGVRADVRLVEGEPVPVLTRVFRTADLGVCGTHGRGTIGGALLGSVSSELARDPYRPLLVVPAPDGRSRRSTPNASTPGTVGSQKANVR